MDLKHEKSYGLFILCGMVFLKGCITCVKNVLMGWFEKVRKARLTVANSIIDATASALDMVGCLACTASGVGLALSYSIDEALSVAYFGAANSTGNLQITLDLTNAGANLTKTLPIIHYSELDGSENLSEYFPADVIRGASLLFGATGICLRAIGTSMQVWQESKYDTENFKTVFDIDIKPPSRQEYAFANASSVLGSLSTITFANAAASAVIFYSGMVGSSYSVTYPPKGKYHVNSLHYKGPIRLEILPFDLHAQQNLSVIDWESNETQTQNNRSLPIHSILASNIKANVSISYGGGLFFRSENSAGFPAAPQIVAGSIFFMGARFFKKKQHMERDDRVVASKLTLCESV